jgi:hypothetical protein
MALADLFKNISADKLVEAARPFIPDKWKNVFSGYGTYAIGALMILSALVSLFGVPLPWVPLGSEGQWIAAGLAAFTIRRSIANQKTTILNAIQENTDLTKKIAETAATPTEVTKKK